KELATALLTAAGFNEVRKDARLPAGLAADLSAVDASGRVWWFDVVGGYTTSRPGLRRSELLWRTMAKAAAVAEADGAAPFVVLTSAAPTTVATGRAALEAVTGPGRPIRDVIVMDEPSAAERLRALQAWSG
ncbi:MAG: hypothetical protein ACTHN0_08145, partial [Aquihabitans sp.]